MHSTSLLWLLKEFQGQNLQNFAPSASAYVFGLRPNFLKRELRLRPNVKNTASVILWSKAVTKQYNKKFITALDERKIQKVFFQNRFL